MPQKSGYTGHLFEEEVLGRCQVRHCGYMQWRAAAEEVRTHQPRQLTRTAAALLQEVRRQAKADVRFYTAVGSAMDYYHGTDGFFEFCGFIVAIDVTMNPQKDCGKAMVVTQDDLDDLPAVAARVIREFATQARRAA